MKHGLILEIVKFIFSFDLGGGGGFHYSTTKLQAGSGDQYVMGGENAVSQRINVITIYISNSFGCVEKADSVTHTL